MAAISIADQLKILIQFQELDAQIYRHRRDLETKPQAAEQLKAAHQKTGLQVQETEKQYKTLEVKRNSMEIDLAQKEAQVKKVQGQLFQVKTNKEYAALQKEIEGFKADQSVLEEEILKFMEEIDRIKATLATQKEQYQQQETKLKTDLSRIEQEKAKIQSEITVLEQSRSTLVPKVDPTVLSQYERILKRKDGVALVSVRGESCSGCNLVLPPQMINEILAATRLIPCESCGRILYIEPSS